MGTQAQAWLREAVSVFGAECKLKLKLPRGRDHPSCQRRVTELATEPAHGLIDPGPPRSLTGHLTSDGVAQVPLA